jgi:hypothetical protein
LAEPEQEPVAWAYVNSDDECEQIEYCTESPLPEFVPLYTAPPKREWVGLTGEEVNHFAAGCHLGNSVQTAIRKAEAKLKEKNT